VSNVEPDQVFLSKITKQARDSFAGRANCLRHFFVSSRGLNAHLSCLPVAPAHQGKQEASEFPGRRPSQHEFVNFAVCVLEFPAHGESGTESQFSIPLDKPE
jgi:hypothetical protein